MNILLSFLITIICYYPILLSGEEFNKADTNYDNNVKIAEEGVRSKKGTLIIAIFRDQESFRDEKPIKKMVLIKTDLTKYELELNLEPGVYGFSILDDENNNNVMDYNFIGKPKEGFGFSNYYHKGFSKPHFDEFKFEITNKTIKLIDIQLRYM